MNKIFSVHDKKTGCEVFGDFFISPEGTLISAHECDNDDGDLTWYVSYHGDEYEVRIHSDER